jgi:TPP-dependent pyruvate/acetoin dehydrogenase alpha subunit
MQPCQGTPAAAAAWHGPAAKAGTHFTDFSRGLIGAFAIVGAELPIALGAAVPAKLRGTSAVALSFFGDGTTNIGTFHEALTLASVWKAPVVFICENNLYGEYSPLRTTTPLDDLATRAVAYPMPGIIVDGNDVDDVYTQTTAAVARARAGEGPTLLECKTYRYSGHSRTDPGTYRKPGEIEAWKAKDPIERLGQALASEGVMSRAEQDALRRQMQDGCFLRLPRWSRCSARTPHAGAGPSITRTAHEPRACRRTGTALPGAQANRLALVMALRLGLGRWHAVPIGAS